METVITIILLINVIIASYFLGVMTYHIKEAPDIHKLPRWVEKLSNAMPILFVIFVIFTIFFGL